VTEVTRSGTPVRAGRFMANRLIALVEHPAQESDGSVDVETRRTIGAPRPRRSTAQDAHDAPRQLTVLGEGADADDPEDGA